MTFKWASRRKPDPQRATRFAEAERLLKHSADLSDRRMRTEAEQARLEAQLVLTRLWKEEL